MSADGLYGSAHGDGQGSPGSVGIGGSGVDGSGVDGSVG